VLEVENGQVTSHEGDFADYLRYKASLAEGVSHAVSISANNTNAANTADSANSPGSAPSSGAVPSPSNEEAPKEKKRLNPIKQKQMEERCAFLEEEVPRVEAAIATTEEQMGVYVSAEETQRLTELAVSLRGQLETLTAEWEDLMMQLEDA